MTFVRRAVKVPIQFYRSFISPLTPATCRFYPTCSEYALEAIELHGAVKGSWLTVKRIAKCHPFHPGGVDLVPLPKDAGSQTEQQSVSRHTRNGLT